MTTNSTDTMTKDAKQSAEAMAKDAKQSGQQLGQQAKESWREAKEDPSPKGIMSAVEDLPTSFYYYAAIGSIAASAALRLFGRKEFANFVGQWPSTFLALGLMNKQLRPSKEM